MQSTPRELTVEPVPVPTGVKWILCDVTAKTCGGPGAKPASAYPQIVLGAKTGAHDFTVTIKNPVRGIQFAPSSDPNGAEAALWVMLGKGQHPHQAGNGSGGQIQNALLADPTTLKFTDLNSNPTALWLSYRLNFVDNQNHEVQPIDPDIKNGGTSLTGGISSSLLIAIAVGSALLAVLLSAVVARRVALAEIRAAAPKSNFNSKVDKKSGPGDINRSV